MDAIGTHIQPEEFQELVFSKRRRASAVLINRIRDFVITTVISSRASAHIFSNVKRERGLKQRRPDGPVADDGQNAHHGAPCATLHQPVYQPSPRWPANLPSPCVPFSSLRIAVILSRAMQRRCIGVLYDATLHATVISSLFL